MEEIDKLSFFEEKYKNALKEPIIKDFLNFEDNRNLFIEAVTLNNKDKMDLLDKKFRDFYHKARLYKYIQSLIKFYSIDFDKRIRKNLSRYPLTLDHTNSEEQSLAKQIPSPEMNFCERNNHVPNSSLLSSIENESLYKAINLLTEKQRKVLDLIYVQGLNNKEVATFFGESPQNISNIHKQAIKKIKKYTIL
jgi:RNA polymerase sigma factor (sigma-70 family)